MPRMSAEARMADRLRLVELGKAEPPEELNPEQAAIWRSYVDRLPADWFPPETHTMLAQLCRHIVRAKEVAKLIETYNGDKTKREYRDLLKLEEDQTKMISQLSTRMRLTQKSSFSGFRTKPKMKKKVWET